MPAWYAYFEDPDVPEGDRRRTLRLRVVDHRFLDADDVAAWAAIYIRHGEYKGAEPAPDKPQALLKPIPAKFTEFGIKRGHLRKGAGGQLLDAQGKPIANPKLSPATAAAVTALQDAPAATINPR